MKKYVIIEDERFACEEIRRMMRSLRPDMELAGWATGVEQAVVMLRQVKDIDLIVADIQLDDGLCFDIFDRIDTTVPIIFTTAYDEYAIRAFKLNSIDYLLKPIEEEDLKTALEKTERRTTENSSLALSHSIQNSLARDGQPKTRFLIQQGDAFYSVPSTDIAFFYSEDKYTFAHLSNGRRHIIDYTLEELDRLLDSHEFFRISRQLIVNISSVVKSTRLFGGRMKVYLKPDCPHEAMVSRSRVPDFVRWLDGQNF